MASVKFRAKFGFDANNQTLTNLADPGTVGKTGRRDPSDGINWRTLREHSAFRIATSENARLLLAQNDKDLTTGDVVLDQDTGLAWQYLKASDTWTPFGRGGVEIVGRQSDLPLEGEDGALYLIQNDLLGAPLERLAAWDETIPARAGSNPVNIVHVQRFTTPTVGIPTQAEIQLAGMAGVADRTAELVMTIATVAGGTHAFQYDIQPGDALADIAAGLAAVYDQSGAHDPATVAVARNDTIQITGTPGSPALPPRTVIGSQFISVVVNDFGIQQFLSASARMPGDYVVNDSGQALTTPDGDPVPPETAVIVESLNPTQYHVADAPTPVVPASLSQQIGSGTPTLASTQAQLIQWLANHPGTTGVGDYILNISGAALIGGGWAIPINTALVMTPAGIQAATAPTPAVPQMTNAWQPLARLADPTDQTSLDALMLDPANQQVGAWFENTTGGILFMTGGPQGNNPNLPSGNNVNLQDGQWARWDDTVGAWEGRAGTPGIAIGGTVIPGAFDPPTTPPTASYPVPIQAPTTQPDATVAAQAAVDPTEFQSVAVTVTNPGAAVVLPGGGWRWLNRRIWAKDDRSDFDQRTDQRHDDLQVTRERDHQEIKAWNDASRQWDTIYSRDQINSAIAALSLFEGTTDEVGGGAIGATEFDQLPDLAALTAAGDLSLVSHYWTYIGNPNLQVAATTPAIGTNLNGAILNPGDWIQISNRGGDGSGIGANGGAIDLHWVTIGGDLLAKARADRLFGLLPWSAAGWEQGALVIYDGDVYRAAQPVTAQDPSPKPTSPTASVALSGTPGSALDGNPLAAFPATPADGAVETATGAGIVVGQTEPFYNQGYTVGDSWVYTADPAFTGSGVTVEGYRYDQGWVALGQTQPIPNPLTVSLTAPTSPWQKVDISGGLKMSQDMAGLPVTAPPGQVWIVLAGGSGQQELWAYDAGTGAWQQIGGGGSPIDLTGGAIVYPKVIYYDADASLGITGAGAPSPERIGDVLAMRNDAGLPVITHISKNGVGWQNYHPERITFNATGAGRTAASDFPTQLNIGISGGKAKITHIADRNRAWLEVAEPITPIYANRANGPKGTTSDVGLIPGEIMGHGIAVADSQIFVGVHSSLDQSSSYEFRYDVFLRVTNQIFCLKNVVKQAGFSNNVAWCDIGYDATGNRIAQSSLIRWHVSAAKFSGAANSINKARLVFSAEVMYSRKNGFEPSILQVNGHVVRYGGAEPRPTLIQFGLSTGAGDIVTHTHLRPSW